jgi:hypothetical protein
MVNNDVVMQYFVMICDGGFGWWLNFITGVILVYTIWGMCERVVSACER